MYCCIIRPTGSSMNKHTYIICTYTVNSVIQCTPCVCLFDRMDTIELKEGKIETI